MDIVDYELSRYDQWREDVEKRRKHFESTTGLFIVACSSNDNSDRKTKNVDEVWSSDYPLEYQLKRCNDDELVEISQDDIARLKEDFEKNRKKFRTMTKKQEQLLKGLFFYYNITY